MLIKRMSVRSFFLSEKAKYSTFDAKVREITSDWRDLLILSVFQKSKSA